ncbi:hypothetical protein GDO81_002135 [Engystomops pustulosus]|uniref:Uncharacterized protein n=1 Tax=Engystomops pustulosus TaxID=76066 RepID=A0AAV7DJ98_ENGPU|nr:hypothetical protein GDO81_002135 [Engystomops pustulosus]
MAAAACALLPEVTWAFRFTNVLSSCTAREFDVTMRLKCRYFLCELVLEDPRWRHSISHSSVLHAVRDAVSKLHGSFGDAACNLGLSSKYGRGLHLRRSYLCDTPAH